MVVVRDGPGFGRGRRSQGRAHGDERNDEVDEDAASDRDDAEECDDASEDDATEDDDAEGAADSE